MNAVIGVPTTVLTMPMWSAFSCSFGEVEGSRPTLQHSFARSTPQQDCRPHPHQRVAVWVDVRERRAQVRGGGEAAEEGERAAAGGQACEQRQGGKA